MGAGPSDVTWTSTQRSSTGGDGTHAARTARVRSVDAFRALAITTVVAGHWLAFALSMQEGQLVADNLLSIWRPAAWLTWGFQVMPVFFLAGGFGNAASWTNHRDSASALGWIGARLSRLLRPTLLLLVVVSATAWAARAAGADPELLGSALTVVGLPLWFLAVYVAVVPLTPMLVEGVRRWGVGLPAGLLGCALAVDVFYVHLGVPLVGLLNYALFWIGVYSLGVAWRSGALAPRRRLPVALAVGGAASLVLLVVLGPYPVSMLAAAGERVQNNGPPSAALVALAMAQTGVVLLLQARVEAWCKNARVWAAVVGLNLVAMSVYLWHLVAGVLAAAVFWWAGAVALATPPSAAWWLWRPAWYALCVVILVPLVLIVRPAERPVAVPATGPPVNRLRLTATVVGVLACCAGMVTLTIGGLAGQSLLPALGVAGFLAGAAAAAWGTGRLSGP